MAPSVDYPWHQTEAVMQRARAFFFVCAGLFLLVLSHHLGARSAGAQAGAVIEGVNASGGPITAVVNGVFEHVDPTTGMIGLTAAIPVPGHVIDTANSFLIYDNGDIYVLADSHNGTWRRSGSIVAGPVPARQESFGSVKVRYR